MEITIKRNTIYRDIKKLLKDGKFTLRHGMPNLIDDNGKCYGCALAAAGLISMIAIKGLPIDEVKEDYDNCGFGSMARYVELHYGINIANIKSMEAGFEGWNPDLVGTLYDRKSYKLGQKIAELVQC